MDLTEKTRHSELLFSGDFLHLYRDEVTLPNGKVSQREYFHHPGAVAIIALTDQHELVMERQYRYAARQTFIELPAGKIDPNEDPLITAQRELHEETGYIAKTWQFLGSAYPCIGYSDEKMYYYLAQDLQSNAAKLDEGEFLEVFLQSVGLTLAQILSGEINDSKTIVGLHLLSAHLKKIEEK